MTPSSASTPEDEPVRYRAEVWEGENGWHWRVEIDVRNGRAWSGLAESRAIAFRMVADRFVVVEQIEGR